MDGPFRVRFEASPEARTPAERLAAVDDLFDTAVQMRRMRFLRENPGASSADAEAAVEAWILESPGYDEEVFRPLSGERLRGVLARTAPR